MQATDLLFCVCVLCWCMRVGLLDGSRYSSILFLGFFNSQQRRPQHQKARRNDTFRPQIQGTGADADTAAHQHRTGAERTLEHRATRVDTKASGCEIVWRLEGFAENRKTFEKFERT